MRLVLLELPNAEMLTAEEISVLAGTPAEMAANHTEQSVETLLQHHYKTKLIYASLASLLVLALAATALFCYTSALERRVSADFVRRNSLTLPSVTAALPAMAISVSPSVRVVLKV